MSRHVGLIADAGRQRISTSFSFRNAGARFAGVSMTGTRAYLSENPSVGRTPVVVADLPVTFPFPLTATLPFSSAEPCYNLAMALAGPSF